MVNIEKKIEEIRQKPEHIRLRYVYSMVAVSMVIILFIWFISLKVNFTDFGSSVDSTVTSVKNQFDIETESGDSSVSPESKSIDELLEESKKRAEQEEGVVN